MRLQLGPDDSWYAITVPFDVQEHALRTIRNEVQRLRDQHVRIPANSMAAYVLSQTMEHVIDVVREKAAAVKRTREAALIDLHKFDAELLRAAFDHQKGLVINAETAWKHAYRILVHRLPLVVRYHYAMYKLNYRRDPHVAFEHLLALSQGETKYIQHLQDAMTVALMLDEVETYYTLAADVPACVDYDSLPLEVRGKIAAEAQKAVPLN